MHGRRELLRSPGTWRGRGHLGRYLGEIATDQHLILRAEWAFCPPPPPPRVSELSCVTDVLGRAGPLATNVLGGRQQRGRVCEEALIREQPRRPFAHSVQEKTEQKVFKEKTSGEDSGRLSSTPSHLRPRPCVCEARDVLWRSGPFQIPLCRQPSEAAPVRRL